jgi:hypothetical protein
VVSPIQWVQSYKRRAVSERSTVVKGSRGEKEVVLWNSLVKRDSNRQRSRIPGHAASWCQNNLQQCTVLLLWLYSPLLCLGRFFSFLIRYTVGRTPWTGDQSVTRLLPTHRINAHNTDIHASSGIRVHTIPAFEKAKKVRVLRPRDHCDRPILTCRNQVTGTGTNKNQICPTSFSVKVSVHMLH